MPSLPMVNTHNQMMSIMAMPSRPRIAHMIELRQLWDEIMALGQNTRSDDFERGLLSSIMVIAFELI